ncbi:MAG: hypothetical protein ACE5H3_00550 [Planctomycetota bacterium]
MVPKPFHLLTDFDGVWTEPDRELDAVRKTLVSELARLAGCPPEEAAGFVEDLAARVRRQPARFGWRVEGRLTSFVDEDTFCLPAAVGHLLETDPDEACARFRNSVVSEYPSVGSFLDECYQGTCARFRREVDHDLTPGASSILSWLLERGVTVTFVTNAPLDKVSGWLASGGFEVTDGRGTAPAEAPLRAIGRAGKQWLDRPGRRLEFSGRPVEVERPSYREILERERPDMLVGDVFSLDLAQPLALRLDGRPGAPASIGLLRRRDTPDWVLASVGPGPGRIDFCIPHITALPRILAGHGI